MTKNKVLAIVGPTAVGKTKLTLFLGKQFDTEIVSCDSVQIFEDLDIGSAKPSLLELASIPHHLISRYPPDRRLNVAIYKRDAEKAIVDILDRGRLPLISGGTGMYFNSLYHGLFSQHTRDDEYRKALESRASEEGLDILHRELLTLIPAAKERIFSSDRPRIIRALEVLHCTGRSIFELQEHNEKLDLEWYVIGLNRDRQELYERIEERVDWMLARGLEVETQGLIEKYGRDAHGLGSIGYRHMMQYLTGRWDYATMVYTLKKDTRHYAKRQLTWFRKNKNIHWYHPDDTGQVKQDVEQFFK